ncbi:MAG: hypothetical protein V1820_05825 [archaeon]
MGDRYTVEDFDRYLRTAATEIVNRHYQATAQAAADAIGIAADVSLSPEESGKYSGVPEELLAISKALFDLTANSSALLKRDSNPAKLKTLAVSRLERADFGKIGAVLGPDLAGCLEGIVEEKTNEYHRAEWINVD